MKLVVIWLGVLVALPLALAGCEVNHRSGDFACTVQADCNNGRVCNQGFCVVPGGNPMVDAARLDGPGTLPDAAVCPAQCSSCDFGAKSCLIDCAVKNCVNTQVVCPVGWNCNVLCSTPNSCRGTGGGSAGVTCAGTLSCTVACTGDGSCRGVACGQGACNVDCVAGNSCTGVRCNQACSCDVTCHGPAACTGVFCSNPLCDSQTGGCSSALSPTCNTCP